jgi:hypothetical protein
MGRASRKSAAAIGRNVGSILVCGSTEQPRREMAGIVGMRQVFWAMYPAHGVCGTRHTACAGYGMAAKKFADAPMQREVEEPRHVC